MTPRERWLAAIRMKPVDRLPFWPKLSGEYPDQHGPKFSGMGHAGMHDWIGSDKHDWTTSCLREVRKRTSLDVNTDDTGRIRTVFRTPHGEMTSVWELSRASNAHHPVVFPVINRETIKWMTEIFEDVAVELDTEKLQQAKNEARDIGRSAVTGDSIGESPLMQWVEEIAGIENAHLLLNDYTAEVEALFDAMHRVLVRKTEILCEHCPADLLYLVENTSTTLISPEQYRRYCARHVGEYARITNSSGRNLVLHMCGHLKKLLPQLANIPAQAFEAFTSPTLGNTSLLDGRTACPDKCLIGGTNAILWLRPADEIIADIKKSLDELPHHRGNVVTSAGVMPPMCKPETIREVCEWVKAYPARM